MVSGCSAGGLIQSSAGVVAQSIEGDMGAGIDATDQLLDPVGVGQSIHYRPLDLGQMHGDALVTQALAELAEHVQTGAVDMVDRRENQQQIPGVRIVAQGLQDGPLDRPGIGEEDVLVDAHRQQSRLDLHQVAAGITEILEMPLSRRPWLSSQSMSRPVLSIWLTAERISSRSRVSG